MLSESGKILGRSRLAQTRTTSIHRPTIQLSLLQIRMSLVRRETFPHPTRRHHNHHAVHRTHIERKQHEHSDADDDKRSVVATGAPYNDSLRRIERNRNDTAFARQLVSELGIDPAHIQRVFRFPKQQQNDRPPLMKITFLSEATQEEALMERSVLRDIPDHSNVYIRPYLPKVVRDQRNILYYGASHKTNSTTCKGTSGLSGPICGYATSEYVLPPAIIPVVVGLLLLLLLIVVAVCIGVISDRRRKTKRLEQRQLADLEMGDHDTLVKCVYNSRSENFELRYVIHDDVRNIDRVDWKRKVEYSDATYATWKAAVAGRRAANGAARNSSETQVKKTR